MIQHITPLFQIGFGTAKESITPEERDALKNGTLRTFFSLPHIEKTMRISTIFFLRQIHSKIGKAVSQDEHPISFTEEGDFIITNVGNLGIGVLTADCLPIIFYDAKHHAVGIAHAGWRGSVIGVGTQTVQAMHDRYETHSDDLQIFLGPSAKVCCYEVKEDVLKELENFSFADDVIVRHERGMFFNLPKFNQLQLEALGIKKEAFHVQYNVCTICQDQYYSNRRQGMCAGRQATIVALK